MLAFVPAALAGPPVHLPKDDPIGGFALNHACGTAVGPDGKIFVSSAGASKVEVFDPSGSHLLSIANGNEPCGLAVDGDGNLYVSERGTGEVSRYEPPSYGAREVVDSSGDAQGISVDAFDDRLYVAKGGWVDAYTADGVLGNDEVQRIFPFEVTGGTYRLSFEGESTGAIPAKASHAVVQTALEALPTIGAGNVVVTQGPFAEEWDHLVTFVGALAKADVEQIACDDSELEGSPSSFCVATTQVQGFNGRLGEGELSGASGVAAYTYKVQGDKSTRYLFVADADEDVVQIFSGFDIRNLKLRRTVAGPQAGEDFGFGPAGAYIAADPGNRAADDSCAKVDKQACTAGHFFVYDDAHDTVDEFDATGEFVAQTTSEALTDAEPTGLAVDRSAGANDGTVYVTSGAGPGAELLAFAPLVAPSRSPLPAPLSHVLAGARAVTVDSHGDVYVASGPNVYVFSPSGSLLTQIAVPRVAYDLAVDSKGHLYVLDGPNADQQMTYYAPSSYPPTTGTAYARHTPSLVPTEEGVLRGVSVDPADDHVLALRTAPAAQTITEFSPPAAGSEPVDECGNGLGLSGGNIDMDVYGATGDVYVTVNPEKLFVIDCEAEEVVREIRGGGCPSGKFPGQPKIAVDQSNGHVIEFERLQAGSTAREYDSSGACVAEFGVFGSNGGAEAIAVDSSGGPSHGNVYIAYDATNNEIQPFDVTAFGPLSYGEGPNAVTEIASGVGGGDATLNGTVEPRGFALEDCHFEYVEDEQYVENGESFAGASTASCVPGVAEIGAVNEAVAVHADVSGLVAETRYRFRLSAQNEFGESQGQAGLFGPPLVTPLSAQPIHFDEAVLRAEIDPSGLPTKYRFEYGTDESYGQSTVEVELPPGDGPVAVQVPVAGLAEETEYHFRLVAVNEAKTVEGPDQQLETRGRPPAQTCPNAAYRTGLSAKLPDCRAYELVTPANINGQEPNAVTGELGTGFNNWLVQPRGPGAGNAVAYFAGTLPGFEGSGETDGYRAQRGPGDHPEEGWTTEFAGPTYAQLGGGSGNNQEGVAADQHYWQWFVSPIEFFENTLAKGRYLRTPPGVANPICNAEATVSPQPEFELIGCGSAGTDSEATSRFVSPGGSHVVFHSRAELEPEAPPAPTQAIYDRVAGQASAEVVSVPPVGASPATVAQFETSDAVYVGTSEDGSAVTFRVSGTLYVHRGGETFEVATAPNTFAGISADGSRVFYMDATFAGDPPPAGLFACDVEAGPCVGGPSPAGLIEIASDSIFVNVSPDGSDVFFTSQEDLPVLPESEPNEAGQEAEANERNLYAWDGSNTRFVAILDPLDFASFGGQALEDMLRWVTAVNAGANSGRAYSPTRSTPDGSALVFQSHAQLTAYDNKGITQIYRYVPAAAPGERLVCVSCDQSNAPAGGEALLQIFAPPGHTQPTTMIPNITDDGGAVFFQSPDRLVPEDANKAIDVYEWKASGVGGCKRLGGCLALISSGQGEEASYLYGMSADGRDVFFEMPEKLVGADTADSVSLYDARVEGGIPDPPPAEVCHGDACQPAGDPPPPLAELGTDADVPDGNVRRTSTRCPKGKRKVQRKGKARCVKQRGKRDGRKRGQRRPPKRGGAGR